jgi:hypothetical protein
MAWAIFALDKRTPFPGLYTIAPVAGAVLMIVFCGSRGAVYRLLSSWPFVSIGLVSYSAYLWHQPVLVVLRKVADPLRDFFWFSSVALIATFSLAALTYFLVEKPFRLLGSRRTLHYALLALVGIVVVGVPVARSGDISARPIFALIERDPQLKAYAEWVDGRRTNDVCGVDSDADGVIRCTLGVKSGRQPDYILWGDSLAGALAFGLNQSLEERGLTAHAYISDGCPPILGLKSSVVPKCTGQTHEAIVEAITATQTTHPEVILLGNVQHSYVDPCCTIGGGPADWSAAKASLLRASQRLEAAGKELIVVQQGPYFPERAAAFYLRNEVFGRSGRHLEIDIASYRAETANLRGLKDQLRIIDTEEFFCNATTCRTKDEYGELMIYDTTHYTHLGSHRFSEFILGRLRDDVVHASGR